ncbi:MAG: hypothetical protein EOO01_39830 [Chitinophagaceae bacterium]|nr:MAG: hypothetical protein EOO01_39830 [Chitinophagaceae bacterium]
MKRRIIFIALIFVCTLSACRDSDIRHYETLVAEEKRKKVIVNDIFFDIQLGMSAKAFYVHCWELNKKGLFTDGMGNTKINYKLVKNELKHPADMNFYPSFKNDKIVGMEALFQYQGWGPWTKELDASHLLPDVVTLFEKWYPGGNPFITIEDPKRGKIYVKVDGNRRIILGHYDDSQVKADFSDLSDSTKI